MGFEVHVLTSHCMFGSDDGGNCLLFPSVFEVSQRNSLLLFVVIIIALLLINIHHHLPGNSCLQSSKENTEINYILFMEY